jgi:hypothetical protein
MQHVLQVLSLPQLSRLHCWRCAQCYGHVIVMGRNYRQSFAVKLVAPGYGA